MAETLIVVFLIFFLFGDTIKDWVVDIIKATKQQ